MQYLITDSYGQVVASHLDLATAKQVAMIQITLGHQDYRAVRDENGLLIDRFWGLWSNDPDRHEGGES
jgi:hypothetical protein